MIYELTGGTAKDRKELGQTLRAATISQGNGCLLLIAGDDHPIVSQVEKIIAGRPFDPKAKVDQIPWKSGVAIIVDSDTQLVLDAIEKMIPGFTAFHGPKIAVPFDKQAKAK